MQNVLMQIVIRLSVIVQNAMMLSVEISYCYSKYFAECVFTGCCYAECFVRSVVMMNFSILIIVILNVIMLSVVMLNYTELRFATSYNYAECLDTECCHT